MNEREREAEAYVNANLTTQVVDEHRCKSDRCRYRRCPTCGVIYVRSVTAEHVNGQPREQDCYECEFDKGLL